MLLFVIRTLISLMRAPVGAVVGILYSPAFLVCFIPEIDNHGLLILAQIIPPHIIEAI